MRAEGRLDVAPDALADSLTLAESDLGVKGDVGSSSSLSLSPRLSRVRSTTGCGAYISSIGVSLGEMGRARPPV